MQGCYVKKQVFLAHCPIECTKEPTHYYHVVSAGGTSWCTRNQHPASTCHSGATQLAGSLCTHIAASAAAVGQAQQHPTCRPEGRLTAAAHCCGCKVGRPASVTLSSLSHALTPHSTCSRLTRRKTKPHRQRRPTGTACVSNPVVWTCSCAAHHPVKTCRVHMP